MDDQKFIDFILKNGKRYRGSPDLPRGVYRGRMGRCYDNSIMPALSGKRFRYVEGISESPNFRGLWVLHGWITDGKVAYDPTWRDVPEGHLYIGVEMDEAAVARFMLRTEYAGIFANAFRDMDAARDCVPGIPTRAVSSCFILDENQGALLAAPKL